MDASKPKAKRRAVKGFPLTGAAADEYLRILSASLDRAHLNDFYPPAENVLASLFAMMSTVHKGLYEGVCVHEETGLPAYNEFIRVETDWRNAREELASLEKWKGARGEGIYEKLAAKRAYLEKLLTLPTFFDERMQLFFRKIDPKTRIALFRLVLDRISTTGYLERITVDLGQEASLWGRKNLALDGKDVVHCQDVLSGLIYRFSTLDVEFLFFQLSRQPHLTVERVIKGRVGPFIFRGVAPQGLEAGMARFAGEGHLFTASLNVADVGQAADAENDPFFSEKALSPEARNQLRESREECRYGILRDRKFVTLNAGKEELQRHLDERKTRNVVYDLGAS